ncbi:unnamed protein product [Clavelina lepadiformis]|uniref:BHLH domain-containing protein n=1 Tax=Clavelina lepadiformis TaxID=159417 RepID=A0ABP0G3V0_CLALP
MVKCRKFDHGNLVEERNSASIAKRNARERRRIKNVNSAFDELRQHVPSGNRKKISKVDTLQSAIEYIKALENLVLRNRRNPEYVSAVIDENQANFCSHSVVDRIPAETDTRDKKGKEFNENFSTPHLHLSNESSSAGLQKNDDATEDPMKANMLNDQTTAMEVSENLLEVVEVMFQNRRSEKAVKTCINKMHSSYVHGDISNELTTAKTLTHSQLDMENDSIFSNTILSPLIDDLVGTPNLESSTWNAYFGSSISRERQRLSSDEIGELTASVATSFCANY